MPETTPPPAAPAATPRIGTFTRVLWTVMAVVGGGNLILASALGSYAGQNLDDPQVAAGLVATAVTGLVLVAPVTLGFIVLRRLVARGIKVRFARTLAALVMVWNIALFLLLGAASPVSTSELLMQRGTWIVDALRGVEPHGPAAGPLVMRRIDELARAEDLSQAIPLLSDETAAGIGIHWVLMLDGTRRGTDDESKLDVLIGTHALDIATLRDDPTAVPDGLDGRALLHDISAVLERARSSDVLSNELLPLGAEPAAIDRRTLALGDGQQARLEDGSWRIHLGDIATLTADTAQQLANAQQLLRGVEPAPTPAPFHADTPDPYVEPRAVLQAALRGRTALVLGTTHFFEEWPEALTRSSAVAQAEALRRSCSQAAGTDPLFGTEHEALRGRYGIGGLAVLGPTELAQLNARGRRYLSEVLTLCAPLFRLSPAASPGGKASDVERARWARLDAADHASSASFTEQGGRLTASFGTEDVQLVQEDGAWRVALIPQE